MLLQSHNRHTVHNLEGRDLNAVYSYIAKNTNEFLLPCLVAVLSTYLIFSRPFLRQFILSYTIS